MTLLTALNGFLLRGAEGIAVAATAVISVVIPYEALGRYPLGETPAWSGEVATYSLAWLTRMGSAAGLKKGCQVGIDSVLRKLPAGSASGCGIGIFFSADLFSGFFTARV